MNNAESVNITIVADNEEKMYQQFSPEDEFSDPMKAYIRSKMASADYRQHIDITVKAREPPYTLFEIRILSPCENRDKTAVIAAMPDANANPCVPPSSSAINASNASLVGFFVREYSYL